MIAVLSRVYARGKNQVEYKSSKIKWLHSLRGVACVIVLVAHIVSTDSNIGGYASGCGKIGVWLFMLFSAFFLMLPYIRDDKKFQLKDFADYYIKKTVRIYPAFLIALVLGIALGLYIFGDVSTMLLFRGAWGHFWYMPVIIKFYFIAPIFIIIYKFIQRISKQNYNAIFIVILSVLAIVFAKIYPYELYDENSIRLVWYIPVFMLGMLVVSLFRDVDTSKGAFLYDIVTFAGVVLIVLQTPLLRRMIWGYEVGPYLQNKYLFIAFCWCLIITGIGKGIIIKKYLEKSRILSFVGDYSYEIYLIHFLILNKLIKFFPNNTMVRGLITIFATVICSFVVKWFCDLLKNVSKYVAFGLIIFLTIVFIVVGGRIDAASCRLYVPTMINKVGHDYFIVDCWHSRILYSDSMNKDLKYWNCLTGDEYIAGHTVCTDGSIIVADNTDNSQVLVYRKENGRYSKVQTLYNVKGRPHFATYDEERGLFYVIASIDSSIYVYKNEGDYLKLQRIDVLPEIKDSYVRSISVIEDKLYCVSGPMCINQYQIGEAGFEFEKAYSVPEQYTGMNQIYKIDNYYYVTINTDSSGSVDATTIVRCRDLNDLATGNVEDLYNEFGFVGQPYFITYFNNRYYITEISADKGNGIKRFSVRNDKIIDIDTVFYWDDVLQDSREVYNAKEAFQNYGTKEIVDLFVFAGQPNMSGKGDPAEAPTVLRGYEYKSISDSEKLYTIEEPFGINENRSDGINDTWENMTVLRKSGSLVSAFANEYYSLTGVPIVGVSASEGATTISQWLPQTENYADLLDRIQRAKIYLTSSEEYELRHTYLVWCQGESDGDNGTSEEEYYNMLNELGTSLVEIGMVEHCFVVGIGEKQGNEPNDYYDIRTAQQRLCNDSDYFSLASSFYGLAEQGLMKDEYHYTQEGYNIIGTRIGDFIGKYVN